MNALPGQRAYDLMLPPEDSFDVNDLSLTESLEFANTAQGREYYDSSDLRNLCECSLGEIRGLMKLNRDLLAALNAIAGRSIVRGLSAKNDALVFMKQAAIDALAKAQS